MRGSVAATFNMHDQEVMRYMLVVFLIKSFGYNSTDKNNAMSPHVMKAGWVGGGCLTDWVQVRIKQQTYFLGYLFDQIHIQLYMM